MELPKISVITPSLNQAEFIEENIRSVLSQKYPDFEHIVIDGESTDGTLDVLRRYPHLKWISGKDRNMTEALNKGFRMATGEIIAWLNTDDRYPENTLLLVGKLLAADRTHEVVFGDVWVIDEIQGDCGVKPGRKFHHEEVIRFWERTYFLHQPAIFFRKELLDRVGYLDESLDLAADYELWTRLSRETEFHYENRVMAEAIRHEGALTASFEAWGVEALEVSRRSWGSPGSLRHFLIWSSWKGTTMMTRALAESEEGKRFKPFALMFGSLMVRPLLLAWLTWWSILARIAGFGGVVDRLKSSFGVS